jgi:hypothetical protein
MKKILIVLTIVFSIFSAKAQLDVNDFNMMTADAPEVIELILHNNVVNNYNQSVNVTWQKIEAANKPTDWRFAICDKITCHYYTVFSNTFSLDADSLSIIDAHLQPRGMEGLSTLLLKVFDNVSSDTVLVSYTFEVSSTLGIENPDVASVKLFPTITNNIVNVISNKNMGRIEVYSLTGKLIKSTELTNPNNARIELAGNYNGIYIFKTFANNGKLLSVNKIIKK